MGSVDRWVLWLIAAVVLGVVEIAGTALVFGMLALGAVAAAITAGLGVSEVGQAVTFLVVSTGLLLFLRPVARRHLIRTPLESRTGVAALIGRSAVVVREVNAHEGRVKIGGEVWSARCYDPTQLLKTGAVVDVIEIDGATALVYGHNLTETP